MNLNLDPFWRSSVGFDRISLAVAGFKPDQISVTVQQNTRVVAGREAKKTDELRPSWYRRA